MNFSKIAVVGEMYGSRFAYNTLQCISLSNDEILQYGNIYNYNARLQKWNHRSTFKKTYAFWL